MNEYSTIAGLKAPINQLSQASKIDIPTCYIICQEVLNTENQLLFMWENFLQGPQEPHLHK